MIYSIYDILNTCSRHQKMVMMALFDIAVCVFAVWFSFWLRLNDYWPPFFERYPQVFIIAPLLSIPVFAGFRLYRQLVRYTGMYALFSIIKAGTLATLLLMSVNLLARLQETPRSVFVLYWGIVIFGIGGGRILMRTFTQRVSQERGSMIRVAIFGAGSAGTQLVKALEGSTHHQPVAFIDDNPELRGTFIHGRKVFTRAKMHHILDELGVEEVLLAMPAAANSKRREILEFLEPFPVEVKTLPGVEHLVEGKVTVADIRRVDIEDLLGRDQVPPIHDLLKKDIAGKSVLVTGAGGSIGSELTRQILDQKPTTLVLYERSEFALYRIEQELQHHLPDGVRLVPLIGSVKDRPRLERAFHTFHTDTVYHAAAYKHVPLVEHNPIEGVVNNVFGTLHAAEAALESGVDTFVLISTDKAVRPTSVMGTSKRLAELVLQGLAKERPNLTRFVMVRFGNVLDSSGSVVPLFRKQIQAGGPVTVTHAEVTRYFMTIQEASQLVIQAGAMGEGGDVFVLDMGEPVKILDMARRMVHLSGLDVRDEKNPNGDIPIEFVGLRPGEKLYEELLIGAAVRGTRHPRIMRAEERDLPWTQMKQLIMDIQKACDSFDSPRLRTILHEAVPEFTHTSGNKDHLLG
ncbi:MAG: polysaccharide biosynthesis protein [Magnetococcales bacterium]|nr:polysaccharide biosynthesis protein [Magnetococcales bacterium]